MYNSFITLFCIVYIFWCTVSYLLYLVACMCSRVALDGAHFEGPQEQDFEDIPKQQQCFDEGKWSLIISRS